MQERQHKERPHTTAKRNILIAFFLNLAFSVFEFWGGFFTGSVSILSDAVHDAGDALSIGISGILEAVSHKKADDRYTYGYLRYSPIGSVITCAVLLCGSGIMIYEAVGRFIHPTTIRYDGMILLAVIGVAVNSAAAFVTSRGESHNQRAVNLHMLEDVLGWGTVLVGAIVMRLTDWPLLDPILSVAVSLYIAVETVKNLKETTELFLERAPDGVSAHDVKNTVQALDGVTDVHHVHLWCLDEENNCATLHVVTNSAPAVIKKSIRDALVPLGIQHVTIETERSDEICTEIDCTVEKHEGGHHHHHHH